MRKKYWPKVRKTVRKNIGAFLNASSLDANGKVNMQETYLGLESDADGFVPVLDTSVVIRKPHIPCTLDVSGAMEFDGKFTKLEEIRNDTFLHGTNMSRFRYLNVNDTTGTYEPECDGWIMEKNGAAPVVVSFYNCSDVPAAANVIFAYTDHPDGLDPATNMTPKIGEMKYPCQWGMDTGFCENSIFNSICAHTCNDFDSQVIKDTNEKINIE